MGKYRIRHAIYVALLPTMIGCLEPPRPVKHPAGTCVYRWIGDLGETENDIDEIKLIKTSGGDGFTWVSCSRLGGEWYCGTVVHRSHWYVDILKPIKCPEGAG